MYRCKTQVFPLPVFHSFSGISHSLHPLFIPWTVLVGLGVFFLSWYSLSFPTHISSSSASFFSVFFNTANAFLDYISPAIVSFRSLISHSFTVAQPAPQVHGENGYLKRLSSLHNLFLFCYHQLFSSMSSIYHSVVPVRIQRQDEYHSLAMPNIFSSSSGHCHAYLSSCHHILTVVKQEKKNSSLIHCCLWSFLLFTNFFLGLLSVSLAINCL